MNGCFFFLLLTLLCILFFKDYFENCSRNKINGNKKKSPPSGKRRTGSECTVNRTFFHFSCLLVLLALADPGPNGFEPKVSLAFSGLPEAAIAPRDPQPPVWAAAVRNLKRIRGWAREKLAATDPGPNPPRFGLSAASTAPKVNIRVYESSSGFDGTGPSQTKPRARS